MISLFAALAGLTSHATVADVEGFFAPPGDAAIARIVARAWDETQGQAPLKISPAHQAELDRDVETGKKYCIEVDKELKATTHPELQQRVDRIGAEMAAIANSHVVDVSWGDKRYSKFDYHFKVVSTKQKDDVNAFTLPGGFVYLYEGLLKFVESDDELAAVLGHEISHADFRHLATLSKEQNRLNLITLPLILISIMTSSHGGTDTFLGTNLVSQAIGSGWSVKAERAADYGSFQFLRMSKYNPTGLLTFMERLAGLERDNLQGGWTIFQTHPPSKERAQSIISLMHEANIPIRRSAVSTSCRVEVVPSDAGKVEVQFAKKRIFAFAGVEALKRADEAALKLNAFFDTLPEPFEIHVSDDGKVIGRKTELFDVLPEDVLATKETEAQILDETMKALKGAIFTLAFRVWDGS